MFKWKISSAAIALAALSALQAHAETGVTKDTIKIGMFAPMTGNLGDLRPLYDRRAGLLQHDQRARRRERPQDRSRA